ELDLFRRGVAGGGDQLRGRHERGSVGDRRRHVLLDDVDPFAALFEKFGGIRHLLAGLTDEFLLAGAADKVVVVVPVADVLQRLEAAEALVAGGDVDGRVFTAGAVVAAVNVDVDAADLVDDIGEPAEVDVDDVVRFDPLFGEFADGLQGQLRAAVGVGGVEAIS